MYNYPYNYDPHEPEDFGNDYNLRNSLSRDFAPPPHAQELQQFSPGSFTPGYVSHPKYDAAPYPVDSGFTEYDIDYSAPVDIYDDPSLTRPSYYGWGPDYNGGAALDFTPSVDRSYSRDFAGSFIRKPVRDPSEPIDANYKYYLMYAARRYYEPPEVYSQDQPGFRSYNMPDLLTYLSQLLQTERYFTDIPDPLDSADDLTGEARQPSDTVARILGLMDSEFESVYRELLRSGMNRRMARYLFGLVVTYTVRNASRYTGNIDQRVTSIFNNLRGQIPWIFIIFRGYGIPTGRVNDIVRSLIRFTLQNLSPQPVPVPPPPQREWSNWADLGGTLTSSPAAASWGRNRLDVFARGTDNALYHIYWNGSRWSNWDSLGGNLTSSPGAVSWGPNRIDVFVRGTTNALFHKWWDGSRWSDWADLGGVLTSAPAAASWAPNRLDVFVRGTTNGLFHKWWDGSRWNDWQDLGGTLTSAPTAVSWGPNRIDVFARGTRNNLIHKWWDGSRWSNWQDLGGNLTSGPTASSRAVNRIDVFARGRNNNLIFKYWNGANWSDWQDLGGNLTSEPSSVSWAPDRIDVFARGQNQRLWHIYKD
jgi:hypothetical protein